MEYGPKPYYQPERNPIWSVAPASPGIEGFSPSARKDAEEAREALGRIGINPDEKLFDITDATGQIVEAFNDLGLVRDREEARDLIGLQMKDLEATLTQDGIKTEVFPFMGLTVDDETLTFSALINRYNLGRKQNPRKDPEATIVRAFWKRYKARSINQRILQHDVMYRPQSLSYPLAMIIGDGRNGLSLTRKDADGQKEVLDNYKRKYDASHNLTQSLLINPVDYLMINSIKRVRGEPLLDRGGLGSTTRFITMSTSPVRNPSITSDEYPAGSSIYENMAFKSLWIWGSRGNGLRLALAPKGDVREDLESIHKQTIDNLTRQMTEAAVKLEFEKAIELRDKIAEIRSAH